MNCTVCDKQTCFCDLGPPWHLICSEEACNWLQWTVEVHDRDREDNQCKLCGGPGFIDADFYGI